MTNPKSKTKKYTKVTNSVQENTQKPTTPKKANRKTKVKHVSPTKDYKFIPRILCFTNIDTEIVCPYHVMQNIISQSYDNLHFIINIFISSKEEEVRYKHMLKDFFNPSTIRINFFLKNIANINNHLIGFKNSEYKNYNMFIYLHALGIYTKNYINTIVDKYNYLIDIITIKFNDTDDHDYNYILNNKSLDILIKHTNDKDWSTLVKDHNLQTATIIGTDCSMLHRSNITVNNIDSTKQNTDYQFIDNTFFTICIFEHHFWSSFVYLNKRNHRMYNIANDDHGAFEIPDDTQIKIQWDTWGDEIFYKKYIDDNIYYYSINQ